MKKCAKIYAIIMTFILSISTFTPAYAAVIDPAGLMASDYLNQYVSYITPIGNGDLEIVFEVYGTYRMDTIGVTTIELQERPSGTANWTTVEIFTIAKYPQLLTTNSSYHLDCVEYGGNVNSSYKAYVTVWAGRDGGGDSRTIETDVVLAY